jgi:uncharacterized membrane-anchored protein YhcB (DUF1043 family)
VRAPALHASQVPRRRVGREAAAWNFDPAPDRLDCAVPEKEIPLEALLLSPAVWLVAAIALGIGVLLGRSLGGGSARREAERARALQEQLEQAQAEQARYRAQVSDHFVETSRRLRDLTTQYKAVYEHLADGARALCPEGVVAIAPSLAEALPATAGTHHDPADEAQLDLELDPEPSRWTRTGGADRDEELGPLLEEEPAPPPVQASESLSRFR